MQETNIREQFAEGNQKFRELFSFVREEHVNTIPFKDSLTSAQVVHHVRKSKIGMRRALQTPEPEANRDAIVSVQLLGGFILLRKKKS